METFMGSFLIVTAIFNISLALLMTTNTTRFFIIFRMTPFIIGVTAIILALLHYGFVIQI